MVYFNRSACCSGGGSGAHWSLNGWIMDRSGNSGGCCVVVVVVVVVVGVVVAVTDVDSVVVGLGVV